MLEISVEQEAKIKRISIDFHGGSGWGSSRPADIVPPKEAVWSAAEMGVLTSLARRRRSEEFDDVQRAYGQRTPIGTEGH